MQMSIKKFIEFKYLINLLIALLPISFIAGNLLINLNIILIVLFSLFFFNKSFLNFKYYLIDKVIVLFFLFSFFVGIINYFSFPHPINIFVTENFLKSFTFLRYLLLYLSIRLIIKNNLFDFKIFYLSSSFCALFVSLDLIFQMVVGVDIFGNLKTPYKLSGPFGDEQIAGSYLQRFSIFLFFLIPSYLNLKNKNNLIVILSIFFVLIFFSMLIAGNKMPIILFLLMFIFLFLYEKKLRKFAFLFCLMGVVLFVLVFKNNLQIQDYTLNFLDRVIEIVIFLNEFFIQRQEPNITNTYLKEFYTGYSVWIDNFFIGGGINSFHINCAKMINYCASHPHNYYLEILAELGIIGFIIIIIIFLKVFLMIGNKNSLNLNFRNNLMFPFVLVFIAEIFPLKTSGSFFTTGNATFIFLIIAIIVSLSKKYSN